MSDDDDSIGRSLSRSTLLRHGVFFVVLAAILLVVTYLVDPFWDYNIAAIGIFTSLG